MSGIPMFTDGDEHAVKVRIRDMASAAGLIRTHLNPPQERKFGQIVAEAFGTRFRVLEVLQPAQGCVRVRLLDRTVERRLTVTYDWTFNP